MHYSIELRQCDRYVLLSSILLIEGVSCALWSTSMATKNLTANVTATQKWQLWFDNDCLLHLFVISQYFGYQINLFLLVLLIRLIFLNLIIWRQHEIFLLSSQRKQKGWNYICKTKLIGLSICSYWNNILFWPVRTTFLLYTRSRRVGVNFGQQIQTRSSIGTDIFVRSVFPPALVSFINSISVRVKDFPDGKMFISTIGCVWSFEHL